MGNLRPLRVDLIFGTAKSHSESRLMNKVSDDARQYHLGPQTRYDHNVMRLDFLVLLIKWRQFQKRSSKNVLSNGSIIELNIYSKAARKTENSTKLGIRNPSPALPLD